MKSLHTLLLAITLLFSSAVFAESVNINTADASQIAEVMNGIGESKAEAIVKYRKANGKFKSLEELENVAGIGSKTIEKNRDKISL